MSKHKAAKHKRRDVPSDSESDSDDHASKRRRKESKRSHKHEHKSHKHSHSDRKSHKSHSSHKAKGEVKALKKALEMAGKSFTKLTAEDYFAKSDEFKVWLVKKRRKHFEDLSTEEAHALFDKFVAAYNDMSLDLMYYTGIPDEVLESCKKTQHKWGFVKRMNDAERMSLASLHDNVAWQTNHGARHVAAPIELVHDAKPGAATAGAAAALGVSPRGGRKEDPADQEERLEVERRARRAQRRRDREHHEVVMEELVPKATGREAMVEKRRAASTSMHGAARERESAIDGLEVGDSVLMGGGESDFQRMLASQRRRKERVHEQRAAKVQEARLREQGKVSALLSQLGLQPGQKIEIKPRET